MCFIAAGYAIVRTSRRVSSTLSQVQCVVDVRREEKYGREVEVGKKLKLGFLLNRFT